MKNCTKCGLCIEDIERKKSWCKKCEASYKSEYYQKNKKEILLKSKMLSEEDLLRIKKYKQIHYKKNKKTLKEKSKQYYIQNRDKIIENSKNYYRENKNDINEYHKTYRKNRKKVDKVYHLKLSIRSLISNSIKRNGYKKTSNTEKIIGCSFLEFKNHIESKFESWMNWGNYGLYNGESNYGWDIDHIKPSSLAIDKESIIKLNHYTNLQPLCSKMNRDIKRNLDI
jgi:peroxiredoxin